MTTGMRSSWISAITRSSDCPDTTQRGPVDHVLGSAPAIKAADETLLTPSPRPAVETPAKPGGQTDSPPAMVVIHWDPTIPRRLSLGRPTGVRYHVVREPTRATALGGPAGGPAARFHGHAALARALPKPALRPRPLRGGPGPLSGDLHLPFRRRGRGACCVSSSRGHAGWSRPVGRRLSARSARPRPLGGPGPTAAGASPLPRRPIARILPELFPAPIAAARPAESARGTAGGTADASAAF